MNKILTEDSLNQEWEFWISLHFGHKHFQIFRWTSPSLLRRTRNVFIKIMCFVKKLSLLGIKEVNISVGVIYCKEVFWQDRGYSVFFQILLYTLNHVPESFNNLWVPFHILSVSAGAILTSLSSKSCYCLHPSVPSFQIATGNCKL